MDEQLTFAYLAGMIDGDGYITINRAAVAVRLTATPGMRYPDE